MRLLMLTFISLLVLLQYHLWFGKNGLQEHRELEQEVAQAVSSNAELVTRNQVMFSEIGIMLFNSFIFDL